jgi:hypothetical protein
MFLAWEVACLGAWGTLSTAAAPASGGGGVIDPVKALASLSSGVGPLVDTFSLLAIITSYIVSLHASLGCSCACLIS